MKDIKYKMRTGIDDLMIEAKKKDPDWRPYILGQPLFRSSFTTKPAGSPNFKTIIKAKEKLRNEEQEKKEKEKKMA